MRDDTEPTSDDSITSAVQPIAPPAPPVRLDLTATGMSTVYTNLFRVTGTFEELLIDFGLHSGIPNGSGPEPIKLSTRLVMTYPTAKRLLAALQLALARHEQVFGTIETDPQRRVKQ